MKVTNNNDFEISSYQLSSIFLPFFDTKQFFHEYINTQEDHSRYDES